MKAIKKENKKKGRIRIIKKKNTHKKNVMPRRKRNERYIKKLNKKQKKGD